MTGYLTKLAAAALIIATSATAETPDPADWPAIEAQARGQTVYWNAWAGSDAVNDYIGWVGEQVQDRFGIRVEHVKLSDTAEAVARVVAERSAGKDAGGAVDLIWINGENFAAMKQQGLLFGPWVTGMPNWSLVDGAANPAVLLDFTVPTDGFEAPWGMAQIVFFHDSARLAAPPRSIPALLDWARANPGRFAYPRPPDFTGSTFLKQVLIAVAPDVSVLQRPADDAVYGAATAPLWDYLDALTPHLWRSGAAYPDNGPRLVQLMADGETDLAFSFNANEAANAVSAGILAESVRSYVLDEGSIANANFLAIPYNANAAAGAMVVANFLLSPEAQARMQDPQIWGQGSVLALDRLTSEGRALFDAAAAGPGSIAPGELGKALAEPHPSWIARLEEDWIARYGVQP